MAGRRVKALCAVPGDPMRSENGGHAFAWPTLRCLLCQPAQRSEVIVQTDGHRVDSILQVARERHPVDGVGQSKVVRAEVVVIVLDIRRPVWSECPIEPRAGRPARPRRGRTGIEHNPKGWPPENNIGLLTGPSGTAPGVNEPAAGEAVA